MSAAGTTYDDWAWFCVAPGGRSPVKKEFERLPPQAQAALWQRMRKFQLGTNAPRDVDHLGDGILEIRVKLSSNPYRVLFFCDGRTLVALTAIRKKDRQTPKRDLDNAKERRQTWLANRR